MRYLDRLHCEDTDAAWLSLRRWAYPGAQGYEGKR